MYPYYDLYYNDFRSRQWGWGGGFGAPFLGGLLLGGLAATAIGGGPWGWGGGFPVYPYYGYPGFF